MITCPECGRTSHHPVDSLVGWCGACERFTRGDTPKQTLAIAHEMDVEGEHGTANSVRGRLLWQLLAEAAAELDENQERVDEAARLTRNKWRCVLTPWRFGRAQQLLDESDETLERLEAMHAFILDNFPEVARARVANIEHPFNKENV